MKRRAFIVALGALAAGRGLAEQPKVRRIGFLYNGSRESAVRSGRYEAFLAGMRASGRVAGKDFVLEEWFSDGRVELLRRFAPELVEAKVDVIVAVGTPAVHEARRATDTIPIVATQLGADPVRGGLAKSFARPGGNVTGVYVSNVELLPKQLELLAAVVPKMTRVGVLTNPNNAAHPALLQDVQGAAQKAGLQVTVWKAGTAEDIQAAIPALVRERAGGLLVIGDTFFVQQSKQIADLALAHRLPLVSTTREYAEAGGLISYGEDSRENFRIAAEYVDRILKGAKPGDLPFRRSQRPRLVLNLRTFQALGLAVPHEIAARADEVVR
jgi:putative tryptophan/tyrosine transport system substrate-binding protein